MHFFFSIQPGHQFIFLIYFTFWTVAISYHWMDISNYNNYSEEMNNNKKNRIKKPNKN